MKTFGEGIISLPVAERDRVRRSLTRPSSATDLFLQSHVTVDLPLRDPDYS